MTFDELFKKYKEECDSLVCEPPAYMYEKKQGEFTVDDFENLQDTQRLELIDGEFVIMDAATIDHQDVSFYLARIFHRYIKSKKGNCRVHQAVGIRPDLNDNKTELVPDVVILCDKSKSDRKRILGCPDLVVEILSPGTRYRDLGVKKRKYQDCGVREYWTVDLKNKCVVVYDFEKGDVTRVYSFEDQVPVGIWGGECKVDLREMVGELE